MAQALVTRFTSTTQKAVSLNHLGGTAALYTHKRHSISFTKSSISRTRRFGITCCTAAKKPWAFTRSSTLCTGGTLSFSRCSAKAPSAPVLTAPLCSSAIPIAVWAQSCIA